MTKSLESNLWPRGKDFYDLVLTCQCNIPVGFGSFIQWALAGNALTSMAHLLRVEGAARETTKAISALVKNCELGFSNSSAASPATHTNITEPFRKRGRKGTDMRDLFLTLISNFRAPYRQQEKLNSTTAENNKQTWLSARHDTKAYLTVWTQIAAVSNEKGNCSTHLEKIKTSWRWSDRFLLKPFATWQIVLF